MLTTCIHFPGVGVTDVPTFLTESLTFYAAKRLTVCALLLLALEIVFSFGLDLCFLFFGVDALSFVFAGLGLLLRGFDNVRQG